MAFILISAGVLALRINERCYSVFALACFRTGCRLIRSSGQISLTERRCRDGLPTQVSDQRSAVKRPPHVKQTVCGDPCK